MYYDIYSIILIILVNINNIISPAIPAATRGAFFWFSWFCVLNSCSCAKQSNEYFIFCNFYIFFRLWVFVIFTSLLSSFHYIKTRTCLDAVLANLPGQAASLGVRSPKPEMDDCWQAGSIQTGLCSTKDSIDAIVIISNGGASWRPNWARAPFLCEVLLPVPCLHACSLEHLYDTSPCINYLFPSDFILYLASSNLASSPIL
jgi:hypothetical protein